MLHQGLQIAETGRKGRGIITTEAILADTIIEVSPVIVMSGKERALLDQTKLHDYIFEWGTNKDQCCMAMGYVPIYNHSQESNCEYFMDYDAAVIFVKTVRDIEAGEEVTINYNGDWNDPTPVWFPTLTP
jgi:SET domain-containing protein